MKEVSKKLFAIVAISMMLGGAFLYFTKKPIDPCLASETLNFGDRFLAPVLIPTSELEWFPEYYTCNQPQQGDIVIYELGTPPEKYARVAVAVGGDEVALYADKNNRGWNITVNGKMVMREGSPYFFGVKGVNPVMNLYLVRGKKKLSPDELILFSTNPPGFNDSGLFGIYTTRSGIKGKVLVPVEKQQEWQSVLDGMFSEEAGKIAEKDSSLLPEKQLAKKKSVPSHKPIPPVSKKPSRRKAQK